MDALGRAPPDREITVSNNWRRLKSWRSRKVTRCDWLLNRLLKTAPPQPKLLILQAA